MPDLDKKYTLFYRGEAIFSLDDLDIAEKALSTVDDSRGTYIQYNEPGIEEYENEY